MVLCVVHKIPFKMMYNTSLNMQGLQCYDDFCTAVKFFGHKTPMLKMGKNL